MKILMISQYYAPEPFRHPDICEELVRRGHQVTAVVGIPNYPMGYVYEDYRHGKRKDEVINGVRVHRCFTVGRRNSTLFRMLNYYSYPFFAAWYVRHLKEKYDVVFVNQLSPVMMAAPAAAYRKKHGTKTVLYCLDLWPESLVAGGIQRGSTLYKVFHRTSARLYKAMDKILITSRSFADYFCQEFGISDTQYLPQYAEALFQPEQCAKKPNETVDLMFAGNVGAAQSVDTIIRAAELTWDIPNLRWHIVGDGSEIERLKLLAGENPNVTFHGRKPLEEMPVYYSMADAMLVTMQPDPVLSLTLPGKVQTYLAAGKPVIGAIDGEAAAVIEAADCGFCAPAGDAEALADCARRFVDADKASMGRNARIFYEDHFDKERFLDTLEAVLKEYAE